MIPIVGYTEDPTTFPAHSVEMRPADTPDLCRQYRNLFCARAATYIGRGFNHSHHRLSGVPGEQDIVVRRCLFPVQALAERLDREYRVLEYLSSTSYPHAPRPIRRISPAEIDGAPAIAITYIDGVKPGFTMSNLRDMGRAVRLLHDLCIPAWMVDEAPTTDSFGILRRMCAGWLAKFQMVEKTMNLADRKQLASILEVVPKWLHERRLSHKTLALLHGDLGDHNLLRSLMDGTLILLDWEFAAVSHPLLDLMWLFHRPGFGEAERRAFLKGYGMLPKVWEEQLPMLCDLPIIEDAIWAQRCIQDIIQGRNHHYFAPIDLAYLQHLVSRIHVVCHQRRNT